MRDVCLVVVRANRLIEWRFLEVIRANSPNEWRFLDGHRANKLNECYMPRRRSWKPAELISFASTSLVQTCRMNGVRLDVVRENRLNEWRFLDVETANRLNQWRLPRRRSCKQAE